MDINTVRIATTVVSFLIFVGIMVWTWSRGRAKDFDQAAHLPFEQD